MSQNKTAEAEKIWEDIKDLPVNMFGFAGKLSSHVNKKAALADGSLYLTAKAGSVINELERICQFDVYGKRLNPPKYDLTTADEGYIILRMPAPSVGDPVKAAKSEAEIVGTTVLMNPPEDKK
jgi:hypothetical protein